MILYHGILLSCCDNVVAAVFNATTLFCIGVEHQLNYCCARKVSFLRGTQKVKITFLR